MSSIVVSNSVPFGAMSNRVVGRIYEVSELIKRVQDASAQASSGYAGTPGTEFEGNNTLFGVQASGAAGDQGSAWQYAFGNLQTAWNTFIASAQASMDALDNGW